MLRLAHGEGYVSVEEKNSRWLNNKMIKFIAVVFVSLAVLFVWAVHQQRTVRLESVLTQPQLFELSPDETILVLSPELAGCDPTQNKISIDVVSGDFSFECGKSSVASSRGGDALTIRIGEELKVITNKDKSIDLVASNVFLTGVVKLATVLGARGFNGKVYPVTMPLHLYALTIVRANLVGAGVVNVFRVMARGSLDMHQEKCVDTSKEGEEIMEKAFTCGLKNTCMENVCGDCCSHNWCEGVQYCCDHCSDSQRDTLGMHGGCGTTSFSGAVLFGARCSENFHFYTECKNQCNEFPVLGSPQDDHSLLSPPKGSDIVLSDSLHGGTNEQQCSSASAYGDVLFSNMAITEPDAWAWAYTVSAAGSYSTPIVTSSGTDALSDKYHVGNFAFNIEDNGCLSGIVALEQSWHIAQDSLWFDALQVPKNLEQWPTQNVYYTKTSSDSFYVCPEDISIPAFVAFHAKVCREEVIFK